MVDQAKLIVTDFSGWAMLRLIRKVESGLVEYD